ncbi:hypothetical protein ACFQL4_09520 [Halosimplex aquaticum]
MPIWLLLPLFEVDEYSAISHSRDSIFPKSLLYHFGIVLYNVALLTVWNRLYGVLDGIYGFSALNSFANVFSLMLSHPELILLELIMMGLFGVGNLIPILFLEQLYKELKQPVNSQSKLKDFE